MTRPTANTARRELCLPAPAKINLFLRVLGRRADNYHELQTLYQFLQLADQLHFKLLPQPTIRRVDLHDFALPQQDLIIRAATKLQARCQPAPGGPPGVEIRLQKIIPPGSGLGGGSSNAATTLLALNRLWRLNLAAEQLAEIAAELGADVPVFVFGHAAGGRGRGDILHRQSPTENWYCMLLPPVRVASADIFQALRLQPRAPIRWQDYLASGGGNDLQATTCRLYPQVATALNALARFGRAQMSGSGSSVFLRCDSAAQAQHVATALAAEHQTVVTRGCNRHPLANW